MSVYDCHSFISYRGQERISEASDISKQPAVRYGIGKQRGGGDGRREEGGRCAATASGYTHLLSETGLHCVTVLFFRCDERCRELPIRKLARHRSPDMSG